MLDFIYNVTLEFLDIAIFVRKVKLLPYAANVAIIV